MLEIVQGLLELGFPPTLALVGGLVWLYLRSSRALKASEAAKKACNDEVHCLNIRISDLETAVLTAQARIVGLETELETRLRAVEGKSAS